MDSYVIIKLTYVSFSSRWAVIARYLPKRTDNEIKNYWNAHLKKRLASMGIDPVTHKPLGTTPASSSANSDATVNAVPPPMAHTIENATTRESEPILQLQSTSRATSASARLLNMLATRVSTLQCVDTLKACQNMCTGEGVANNESAVCHPTSNSRGNNASKAAEASAECYASDDGGVSVDDYNIQSPVSDAFTNILDNNAAQPERSFSSTSTRVLNTMASKFAALRCIDELHDRRNTLPGPNQGDSDTTTTEDGGLSGNVNIDATIYDMVGSPILYDSNYLEDELEPLDLFDVP